MHRARLLAGLLALLLTIDTVAYAQKSGSRSYSSGGRKQFKRRRWQKRYSSGGGKSYSSGNSSHSTPSPSTPSVSVAAKPVSSGGKSYSSGTNSYSSPAPSSPSVASRPVSGIGNNTSSSGNSYSTGNRSYSAVPPGGSSKPAGGAFDSGAAAAQKRVESKASYTKGPEPRLPTTPSPGPAVPITQPIGPRKSYSNSNRSYTSPVSPGPSTPSVAVAPMPVGGSGDKTYSSNNSYSVGKKSYTAYRFSERQQQTGERNV